MDTKFNGLPEAGPKIVYIRPVAVVRELGVPVRFIGVGEQIDDLRPFSAKDFVDALFE